MDWSLFSNPSKSPERLLRDFFVGWDRGNWQYDERTIRLLQRRFPFQGKAYRVTPYSTFGGPKDRGPFSFSRTMQGVKTFASLIKLPGKTLPLYEAQIVDGIDVEEAARWYLATKPRIPARHMQHLIDFEEVLAVSRPTLKQIGVIDPWKTARPQARP